MKRLSLVFLGVIMTVAMANGQNAPKWIRHAAISPDGTVVAFSYQGDIYTVSAYGGDAKQLTTNPAHDSEPVWSEDGKTIYFTSYRELSKDIWSIPAEGGTPKRITTYSGNETPLCFANGRLWFSANIQQDPKYGEFPGSVQLYSVGPQGGKIKLESPISMANLSINANGIMLYEDIKGYEDALRKHHTSSVTRDIWKYLPKKDSYVKITEFNGEDRNPVFESAGSSTYYYLSEQSGTFNVWKADISNSIEATQVTNFNTHPVRNLSVSQRDLIAYSYNGEIYVQRKSEAEGKKLAINLLKDNNERESIRRDISSGVSQIAVSPDGKEIALVAHGDVFVVNPELKITKRITNTPSQERNVAFGKDGHTLYYSAERDGEWAIWSSKLTGKQEYFTLEDNFKEERFTKRGKTCFQPSVSPDGKTMAYLQDRCNLVVKDIKSGKETMLLENVNYSYTDGDMEFEWSPDSKYLLSTYMGEGGWNNSDIALIDIAKKKVTNITLSGYSDHSFRWSPDGNAMYWQSDKNGYRSHGSWGSQDDIYAMFFNEESFKKYQESEERQKMNKALQEPRDKEKKAKEPDNKVKISLTGLEDRTVRQTPYSSSLGDFLPSKDGKAIYFFQNIKGKSCLCKLEKDSPQVKIIKEGMRGGFYTDAEQKKIFINDGSIWEFKPEADKLEKIEFQSEYDYQPAKERAYIYEHVCKQVQEKFYDKNIHNINWSGISENYRAFLPYITNNFDFQELLSELLGELNGSHTGGRYYPKAELNTGHIGILWDDEYRGKGLRVAEILPGSTVALECPDLKAGSVLTAIDGKEIEAGTNWYDAFFGKAGKLITLKFKGIKDDVRVEAQYSDNEALYKRWVRQREEMTERLSGGYIGYVHVEGMDSQSFREVFFKALGKYRNCKALIVDTRHNGGGWLTDDLINFLNGEEYLRHTPRGRYIGSEPFNKWCRPSCVLVGEDNYSDASGFPYAYQTLGVGKLIGAPVPGTMTAVWWERQIDPTLIFGIPQVTTVSAKDGTILENSQIEPDILIYNTPESLLKGKDLQLEAAVKEMLKEIR